MKNTLLAAVAVLSLGFTGSAFAQTGDAAVAGAANVPGRVVAGSVGIATGATRLGLDTAGNVVRTGVGVATGAVNTATGLAAGAIQTGFGVVGAVTEPVFGLVTPPGPVVVPARRVRVVRAAPALRGNAAVWPDSPYGAGDACDYQNCAGR